MNTIFECESVSKARENLNFFKADFYKPSLVILREISKRLLKILLTYYIKARENSKYFPISHKLYLLKIVDFEFDFTEPRIII